MQSHIVLRYPPAAYSLPKVCTCTCWSLKCIHNPFAKELDSQGLSLCIKQHVMYRTTQNIAMIPLSLPLSFSKFWGLGLCHLRTSSQSARTQLLLKDMATLLLSPSSKMCSSQVCWPRQPLRLVPGAKGAHKGVQFGCQPPGMGLGSTGSSCRGGSQSLSYPLTLKEAVL